MALAVFLQGPGDVSAAKVMTLQGQLNMVQVNGTFGSSCLQTVRKILDANRNGVFRVRNASRRSGILGVIATLGGLHGVIAPTTGFLHHNGLDQQNVIRDSQ